MESRLELKESWKRNKEKNHQRDGGKVGKNGVNEARRKVFYKIRKGISAQRMVH